MILKTRKAFTLAELMVCLLLISVLATILLPAIMQNRPNKNKVMFRKAYYIIERVVSELINDDDLYPTNEELNVSGFANTAEVTYAGNTYSGASKFCNLFFEKVNTTTGEARCNSSGETPSAVPTDEETEGSFMTNDGVIWYMPATKVFANADYAPVPDSTDPATGEPIPGTPGGAIEQEINVDINGIAEPNCTYDEDTCTNPDRFVVFVRYDGKVRVEGDKEREYLMSNSTLK